MEELKGKSMTEGFEWMKNERIPELVAMLAEKEKQSSALAESLEMREQDIAMLQEKLAAAEKQVEETAEKAAEMAIALQGELEKMGEQLEEQAIAAEEEEENLQEKLEEAEAKLSLEPFQDVSEGTEPVGEGAGAAEIDLVGEMNRLRKDDGIEAAIRYYREHAADIDRSFKK